MERGIVYGTAGKNISALAKVFWFVGCYLAWRMDYHGINGLAMGNTLNL